MNEYIIKFKKITFVSLKVIFYEVQTTNNRTIK